jgi:hypothetical protein
VLLQEIDEIFKIFRTLGTPTEETWPGVHDLPDFKDSFPKWAPRKLEEVCTPPNPLPFSSHCKLLAVLCIMQAMPSNKCPSEPPIKRLCSDHNHLAPKPWHCPGQAEFNVPAGATEHGFLTVHSAARGSKKAKVNVPRAPRGLMIGTASTLTGG